MLKLVLLRHGQSTWNQQNRFTGWTDVDLTDQGRQEATHAGELLKAGGYEFDRAYTSVLKRAIQTLDLTLEALDELWVPVEKSWRLNERFYGALQGLNKAETAEKYGAEQVHKWRRDAHERPPALTPADDRYPGHDRRYQPLTPAQLPRTENLLDTMARVLPYWEGTITPALRTGQRLLIAAHGNSLRALVQHLDHLSDEEVIELEIPTGQPLVYELDDELRAVKHYYLG